MLTITHMRMHTRSTKTAVAAAAPPTMKSHNEWKNLFGI